MRTGRRLALDVGKARIGVALSDFHGILASPLGFLNRLETLEQTVGQWQGFVNEHPELQDIDLLECYVGLPLSLSGASTESTSDAILVGSAFAAVIPCDFRFIDERLTTVTAAANLRAVGIDAKSGRSKIDSIAATLILEQALASEKSTERLPGISLMEAENLHG
jgi:putative Holliday junction resolvase